MKVIIDEEKIIDLLETEWGYEGIREEVSKLLRENGTPYNPSGDTISREALKEQINTMDFDFGDYYDNTETIIKLVCDVIDNAPPVFAYTDDDMCKATVDGYDAAKRQFERPQGECKTCRHRDPEDKKCDCGGQERQGCPFPVSDDYFCKYYEKGGAE